MERKGRTFEGIDVEGEILDAIYMFIGDLECYAGAARSVDTQEQVLNEMAYLVTVLARSRDFMQRVMDSGQPELPNIPGDSW